MGSLTLNALDVLALRTEAAKQPPPAIVDLSDYNSELHQSMADEVYVSGWINGAYSAGLTGSRRDRGSVYTWVMFGAADSADSKQVRAVVVMNERQHTWLVSRLHDHRIGSEAGQPLRAFNGTASKYARRASRIEEGLASQGLSKADNFIYLTPFTPDRETALASKEEVIKLILASIFWVSIGLRNAFFGKYVYKPKSARAKNVPHTAKVAALTQEQSLRAGIVGTQRKRVNWWRLLRMFLAVCLICLILAVTFKLLFWRLVMVFVPVWFLSELSWVFRWFVLGPALVVLSIAMLHGNFNLDLGPSLALPIAFWGASFINRRHLPAIFGLR